MSKSSHQKRLKAAFKLIDDEFARGAVKGLDTWVVMTVDDIANATLTGYKNVKEKRKDPNMPDLPKDVIVKAAKNKWLPALKLYADTTGTGGSNGLSLDKQNSNSNQIAVNMKNKEHAEFFRKVKNMQVATTNEWLEGAGQSKMGNAYSEWESRNKDIEERNARGGAQSPLIPKDDIWKSASSSETGAFKRGANKIHTGGTTVGMARLAVMKNWLNQNQFFKGFVTSGRWKSLDDKFGAIDLVFKSSGMKGLTTAGVKLRLAENMRVEMRLGNSLSNYSRSELEDWANIVEVLEPMLESYMEKVDWTKEKGSNTFEEDAILALRAVTIAQLTKNKKAKIKGRPPTARKREPKEASHKEKGRGKPRSSGSRAAVVSTIAKKAKKRGATAQRGVSSLNLLAIINNKLPATIKKNMGSPRLENRTGKFANSVRLTDIGQTPQGHPSIGYTYAKDPYQVFEVGKGGSSWASSDRDPRKLIEGSIREIAANLALGRFYTRRV